MMDTVTRTLTLDADVSAFLDAHAARCGVSPDMAANAIIKRGLHEWHGEAHDPAAAVQQHLNQHRHLGAVQRETSADD